MFAIRITGKETGLVFTFGSYSERADAEKACERMRKANPAPQFISREVVEV